MENKRESFFREIENDLKEGDFIIVSSSKTLRNPIVKLAAIFGIALALGLPTAAKAADCNSTTMPAAADFTVHLKDNGNPEEIAEARQTLERKFNVKFSENVFEVGSSSLAGHKTAIRSVVCGKPEDVKDLRNAAWIIRMATGASVEVGKIALVEENVASISPSPRM